MRHGSLFSGIGGFDLAAEWMGWENVFHCEWNEFGQKVLKYHFPKSISYHDITKTDFTIHRGQIDVITGGFPCQPYSLAGKRLGKADDRHLWPEMLRAIREIQPTWVVGENVRGLVNWNGGMVFNEVQAELEAEGYEVLPFILPACAVNAPHRRDRIWFVAYSDRYARRLLCRHETRSRRKGEEYCKSCNNGNNESSADPKFEGLERHDERDRCSINWENKGLQFGTKDKFIITDTKRSGRGEIVCELQREKPNGEITNSADEQINWANFPTQPPVCSRNDGLSRELDGITFSKWRSESIKAYGNAIVPQVALQIFKAIQQYQDNGKNHKELLHYGVRQLQGIQAIW